MSNSNWLEHPNPKHTSFPVHGTSQVTALILWKTTSSINNNHSSTSTYNIITASDDHTIHIHSPSGHLLQSLEGHTGGVWALSLHSDSRTLVSGSTDKSTRIWDLHTGHCTHIFRRHTSTVRCQAIAQDSVDVDSNGELLLPNGPLIVTGSRDKTLCVWRLPKPGDREHKDVEEEEEEEGSDNPYYVFRAKGHEDTIRSVSAYGRTAASASYDHTVRVWDLITQQCLHILKGHTHQGSFGRFPPMIYVNPPLTPPPVVYSVILDPTRDQVYSASMDSTVRIWDLKKDGGTCKHILARHSSLVGVLSLSPSFLISGAADGLLCIWDPRTGDLVHSSEQNDSVVTAIQHDDNKALSGSDGLVRVHDIKSGKVRDLWNEKKRGCWVVSRLAYGGSLCVVATKDNKSFIDVWDFR